MHRFGPEDGAPLVALHGVTGHGIRFQRLAEEGLPERRVIAPDLRGHGRSTWEPPWNAERPVTDLVELLDAEGLERADVMGHSYGGLLTTLLIERTPERIGRAVLLDPAIAIPAEDAMEAAEDTRLDDGWASDEEAYDARREGRPPHTLPMVDADLAETLDEGPDGRFRMRFSRPAVVTAWGEMARAAPVARRLDRRAAAGAGGVRRLRRRSRAPGAAPRSRRAVHRAAGGGRAHRLLGRVRGMVAALRPFLVPQD